MHFGNSDPGNLISLTPNVSGFEPYRLGPRISVAVPGVPGKTRSMREESEWEFDVEEVLFSAAHDVWGFFNFEDFVVKKMGELDVHMRRLLALDGQ